MNIIEVGYDWKGKFLTRTTTGFIVLHHSAGTGTPEAIHAQHIKDGSIGIGYQFYVRKDGSIYRGRPIDVHGAHTIGYNGKSVAVCFEGNYETTKIMPTAQKKAGMELVAYLRNLYPKAVVKKHNEFNATACPGHYFPFYIIAKGKADFETVKDIVAELELNGVITNTSLWLKKLGEDKNTYWLARKAANQTVKGSGTELTKVNDIVWELHHRGIITDKELWLGKFANDEDAYWLGRKICAKTVNRG